MHAAAVVPAHHLLSKRARRSRTAIAKVELLAERPVKQRSERAAQWRGLQLAISTYDEDKTPLIGGRVTSWGVAIFAICLSMNWGAIRLIAFNTLLRPGRISSLPASMPEIARLSAIE